MRGLYVFYCTSKRIHTIALRSALRNDSVRFVINLLFKGSAHELSPYGRGFGSRLFLTAQDIVYHRSADLASALSQSYSRWKGVPTWQVRCKKCQVKSNDGRRKEQQNCTYEMKILKYTASFSCEECGREQKRGCPYSRIVHCLTCERSQVQSFFSLEWNGVILGCLSLEGITRFLFCHKNSQKLWSFGEEEWRMGTNRLEGAFISHAYVMSSRQGMSLKKLLEVFCTYWEERSIFEKIFWGYSIARIRTCHDPASRSQSLVCTCALANSRGNISRCLATLNALHEPSERIVNPSENDFR